MMRLFAAFCLCLALAACATAPANRVSLPGAPPSGEPAGLMGLPASDIRAGFGRPAFVRKDGGIEMWRYDGSVCKAFFFFYPSGASLVVRHVETLPRGTTIAADMRCLNILRGNLSPPVS